MGKVYLYLIKRNKGDAKVIGSVISTHQFQASRLSDLGVLGMSSQERTDLEKVIESHRMEWEPWLESADDYLQLRDKLHKRGVNAPPSTNTPLINFSASELSKVVAVKLNKNKTMIRRMS